LAESKEPSPTLISKNQIPQSERWKRKKQGQKEVSHGLWKRTCDFILLKYHVGKTNNNTWYKNSEFAAEVSENKAKIIQ
jgi:hypothetical protein